jgi:hypothetical protein
MAVTPVEGIPLFWGNNSNYQLAQADINPSLTGFPMPGK